MNQDILFSFNDAPFNRALKSMIKNMDTFEKKTVSAVSKIAKTSTIKFKEISKTLIEKVAKSKVFDLLQDNAKKTFANIVKMAKGAGKSIAEAMKRKKGPKSGGDDSGGGGFSIGKMAAIATGIGAAVGGVMALLKFIPEIGRTFMVVSNVFFKNFLWPLRKELMPILQGIMNWARDNRANFAKWGQVVANVFKVVMVIGKQFFRLLKVAGEAFMESIGSKFNGLTGTIEKTVQLVLFRVSSVLIWLSARLEPVMAGIGKTFGFIVKAMKNFWTGFAEGAIGLGDMLKTRLEPIMKRVRDIFKRMNITSSDMAKTLKLLMSVYKGLGKVIGVTFVKAIELALIGIEKLFAGLEKLQKLGIKAGAGIGGLFGKRSGKFSQQSDDMTAWAQFAINRGKSGGARLGFEDWQKKGRPVKDAIITNGGKTVLTPDPEDILIATKNVAGLTGGGRGRGGSKDIRISFDVGGINLSGVDGGNIQDKVVGAFDTLKDQIGRLVRETLLNDGIESGEFA